jgi:DNA-binding transcriptional MerR regulator
VPDPESLSLPAIPAKTYFKIGEVARITRLEPHVLRYWETEFRTLQPEKSRSGQRLYRREHIERILEVKDLLYRQKFTIAGARRRLLQRHDKSAVDRELDGMRSSHSEELRTRDQQQRETLESIRRDLLAIRKRINLG